MFKNETVFVLGAGASWHYGYPTGEGLVDDVIAMAGRVSAHCADREKLNYFSDSLPKIVRLGRRQGGPQHTLRHGVRLSANARRSLIALERYAPRDRFLSGTEQDLRDIGT